MGCLSIVLNSQLLDLNVSQQTEEAKLNNLLNSFNELFLKLENTIIERSLGEPLYIPASKLRENNKILFSHGFFASALHEMSHWLVAGEQRRKLEDYGYWYKPDGRSLVEQQEFEKVEIRPQAIEWILSVSCQHTFHFSADNLSAGFAISEKFKRSVSEQAQSLIVNGLPDRMERLVNVLVKAFATQRPCVEDFI